ncbi:hypothetical protein AB0G74_17400 [Streptomyces sp. NPDC020875]|uniref:hypothetical protein n=1 Tax=Streptomyces sp. NPDC020875 TaxID=3154898 RepID=UPI0033C69FCC
MERDEVLRRLNELAWEGVFGTPGADRLIRAGVDALLVGIDSPSLPALAGLLRHEEPEARGLFEEMLDELGLRWEPPADPVEAKWAMAERVAAQIADGTLDPVFGARLLYWEIAEALRFPDSLGELMACGMEVVGLDTARAESDEELCRETVAAARRFVEARRRVRVPRP